MPNWAEGTMKIRGTKENIMKFFENGLEAVDTGGGIAMVLAQLYGKDVKQESKKIDFKIDEWKTIISAPEGLHIKGTRRARIDGSISFDHDDIQVDETLMVVIDDFKQAWGVDSESFAKISAEYDIDIRIYVFERGMEFNQEIEIHKGKIVKDREIKFDDYEWECLMPHMGG